MMSAGSIEKNMENAAADFTDLWKQIEDSQGIHVTTMGGLRDRFSYSRLGNGVCAEIRSTLDGWGIGTLPEELPARQDEPVRLYRKGTQMAELIASVAHPTNEGDTRLRRAAGTDQAGIVEQIRLLIS